MTFSAPVGSIDLPAEAEDGTPYEIWPCPDCLPWHAEVIGTGDRVVVREWHAIDCPQFQEVVSNGD